MIRLPFLFFGIMTCLATITLAQGGWNWPEDPSTKSIALEKQAYYKVQMELEDYQGSLSTLYWLYNNNAELHGSIYKDGAKNIEDILQTNLTDERKAELEDSLLWMYDQRIELFGDLSAVDRKAYTAFKMYYRNSEKYSLLADLYQKLYTIDVTEISDFNLTPYMTLAVYYYKSKPAEMPAEKVIDIYDKISWVIDQKTANGTDPTKMKKEQDKVDAMFNTVDLLNCQVIEEKFVPKFHDNPTDLNIIKKVFSYSVKAKCIDQPYFLEAAEALYKLDPTYGLAKTIGDKYFSVDSYIKAIEFYRFAQTMTESDEDKFELLYNEALSYARLANKSMARTKAIEALSIKPDGLKAYNLIGNLYFGSYLDCKEGKSKVLDRGVYLVAYDMYEKAGNSEQMEATKAQFPSIEEIFSEGYSEGDKITVGCWINVNTTIRRR